MAKITTLGLTHGMKTEYSVLINGTDYSHLPIDEINYKPTGKTYIVEVLTY